MSITEIIKEYNDFMKSSENIAKIQENYGGYLRGSKGMLLEKITKELVQIAIDELKLKDIHIDSKKEKLYDEDNNFYNFSIDIQVKHNDKILFTIENKNYCDTSMFKRVVFDSNIALLCQNVKQTYLLQFEDSMNNQGVGTNIDYSPTTNYILKFAKNTNLKIMTLLNGQRDSKKPINKIQFFKELNHKVLNDVKDEFKKCFISLGYGV